MLHAMLCVRNVAHLLASSAHHSDTQHTVAPTIIDTGVRSGLAKQVKLHKTVHVESTSAWIRCSAAFSDFVTNMTDAIQVTNHRSALDTFERLI